jgi:ABC-type uncharacterized transport system substrate-binding protein
MKRILSVVMMVILLAAVAGAAAPLTIGICKIVEHPALDAVEQGTSDALTAAGYEEGRRRVHPRQCAGRSRHGRRHRAELPGAGR